MILLALCLLADSVLLMNDTQYILTATVIAADGTFLGEQTVQAGQQIRFNAGLSVTHFTPPGRPDVSMSPYTVVWQCSSEGFYSACPGVSPCAMVRANNCDGAHYCQPKKKAAQ